MKDLMIIVLLVAAFISAVIAVFVLVFNQKLFAFAEGAFFLIFFEVFVLLEISVFLEASVFFEILAELFFTGFLIALRHFFYVQTSDSFLVSLPPAVIMEAYRKNGGANYGKALF